MKYARGKNPNSRNGFKVGHKTNLGNKFAQGSKHTEEWKEQARKRMLGNSRGFAKGNPSPRKGKKASNPAWNKGMKFPEKSGENHPNWIHDRSLVRGTEKRMSPLYKQWQKWVYRRDGFKCQLSSYECQGRIEAHHIKRWSEYPNERFNVSNGITLCKFHHPKKKVEENKLAPLFIRIVELIELHSSE